MAIVLTPAERTTQLRLLRSRLNSAIRNNRTLGQLIDSMESAGESPYSVQAAADAILTDLDSDITAIGTALGALNTEHKFKLTIGSPPWFQAVRVNHQDLIHGSLGTIRLLAAVEGTLDIFRGLEAGDVIRISGAEDASNDGIKKVSYTPQACSLTSLLANGTFTGSAASWTLTAGAGAIAYGTNNVDLSGPATGTIKQEKANMTTPWTNGVPYLVTFTLTGTGTMNVGTNTTTYRVVAGPGGATSYEVIVVADSHADGLVFTPTLYTGTLDTVSCVPWTGLALTAALGATNANDSTMQIELEER